MTEQRCNSEPMELIFFQSKQWKEEIEKKQIDNYEPMEFTSSQVKQWKEDMVILAINDTGQYCIASPLKELKEIGQY